MSRNRYLLIFVLAASLLASLYISATRLRREATASRVEIAMDWSDLSSLARSYDYNPRSLLIEMRRAGLTSLAVSEELGSSVNSGHEATISSGQSLIDQARLGGIADPTLAGLLKHGKIDPNTLYFSIMTSEAKTRYLDHLALHFDPRSIHVLRNEPPYLVSVRSELDYVTSLGLGLPDEPMTLTRDLHLLLIPRIQNDERYGPQQIKSLFQSFYNHERVSTVIFFGLRNQVLGFPDHIADTAAAFKASHLNFGTIETYDNSQIQKGNEELARQIIGQTVRVQAIAKTELDKLEYDAVVARYLLGARERNVRVIYLRPFLHQKGNLSVQQTNIAMIHDIAEGLDARGLWVGRSTPIPAFRVNPIVLGIATLATPAVILLILDLLNFTIGLDLWLSVFAIDIIVFAAGLFLHHETLAAKIIALVGAIGFAVLAVLVLAPRFRAPDIPTTYLGSLSNGFVTMLIGTLVALAGALVVVGLVSTPLTMEEIERFTGVKAILLAPPLIVLGIYLFTEVFQHKMVQMRSLFDEPVRVYQLVFGFVLLVAGVVYLARSGNQSDIAPTAFELMLRSKLTVLLSVRPRFKEFLIGFPMMVLLPSLTPLHRRQMGWLAAVAISIGLADTIDTFSHLHTPLLVSLFRLVNGMVIGLIFGAIAIAIYRRTPITPAHFEQLL